MPEELIKEKPKEETVMIKTYLGPEMQKKWEKLKNAKGIESDTEMLRLLIAEKYLDLLKEYGPNFG